MLDDNVFCCRSNFVNEVNYYIKNENVSVNELREAFAQLVELYLYNLAVDKVFHAQLSKIINEDVVEECAAFRDRKLEYAEMQCEQEKNILKRIEILIDCNN